MVVCSHVVRNGGSTYGTAWKVLARYARSASPPTEPVRPKMHAYLRYRCGVHRQERKVSWQGVRVGGRAVG